MARVIDRQARCRERASVKAEFKAEVFCLVSSVIGTEDFHRTYGDQYIFTLPKSKIQTRGQANNSEPNEMFHKKVKNKQGKIAK